MKEVDDLRQAEADEVELNERIRANADERRSLMTELHSIRRRRAEAAQKIVEAAKVEAEKEKK